MNLLLSQDEIRESIAGVSASMKTVWAGTGVVELRFVPRIDGYRVGGPESGCGYDVG